jgi:cardiolipin synthase
MNFDNRSLAFNDESNLVMFDQRLGARMDSIFLSDIAQATEIKLESFRRRPWYHRLLENGANVVSRLL